MLCYFVNRYPVGCHFLFQGIFPTQGLNPGLPHCRQTLYHIAGRLFTDWATREDLIGNLLKLFHCWAGHAWKVSNPDFRCLEIMGTIEQEPFVNWKILTTSEWPIWTGRRPNNFYIWVLIETFTFDSFRCLVSIKWAMPSEMTALEAVPENK